jgi:lambda family phage portal protein
VAVSRILDARGNLIRRGAPRALNARYDAAQWTDENKRHWQWSDHFSARAANSFGVRKILRERARYEVANNSYAKGMVVTLANDLIGIGPQLQMQTPDSSLNRRVESLFYEWSDRVGLPEKLRTMRQSRAVDGEAFLFFSSDPRFPDVQLDLKLYEADQVMTPFPYAVDPMQIDGVELDSYGKPSIYYLLKYHPGDFVSFSYGRDSYERIPARYVIHWFRADRPDQFRGIPDITPALHLFAQMRRYTLAVLAAAETAADFAALLESELPPDSDDTDDTVAAFSSTEIERRMMTALPAGYKLAQFRAEQPTTTYEMFKCELLKEIARCLNMPYNVAAGDSSSYNYASGRLDHQTYYRSLRVDQSHLECTALDRVLTAYLTEAVAVIPGLPDTLLTPDGSVHRWLWQGMEHVDPEKEANAQATRLANLMTTFSDECQKQGVDPESRAQTIASDLAMFERLGIPIPAAWSGASPAPPQSQPQGGSDGGSSTDQGGGYANARKALVHRNGHS